MPALGDQPVLVDYEELGVGLLEMEAGYLVQRVPDGEESGSSGRGPPVHLSSETALLLSLKHSDQLTNNRVSAYQCCQRRI